MRIVTYYTNDDSGKRARARDNAIKQASTCFDVIRQLTARLHKTIYANQDGLSANDVMIAMGNDGVELLSVLDALSLAANTLVPDSVSVDPPADKTVIRNPDGSVTVGNRR